MDDDMWGAPPDNNDIGYGAMPEMDNSIWGDSEDNVAGGYGSGAGSGGNTWDGGTSNSQTSNQAGNVETGFESGFAETSSGGDMQQGNFNGENTGDVNDVAWDKKKTGVVAIILVFVLLILLLTIKTKLGSKKLEKTTEPETTQSVEFQTEEPAVENGEENPSINGENPAVSEESESSGGEEPSPEDILNKAKELQQQAEEESVVTEQQTTQAVQQQVPSTEGVVIPQENGGLEPVNPPALSETLSTSGMVQAKNIYKIGNSYVYELNLVIILGETNMNVSYFCPKNPYDALESGTPVNVEYQVDSAGNISICSISR